MVHLQNIYITEEIKSSINTFTVTQILTILECTFPPNDLWKMSLDLERLEKLESFRLDLNNYHSNMNYLTLQYVDGKQVFYEVKYLEKEKTALVQEKKWEEINQDRYMDASRCPVLKVKLVKFEKITVYNTSLAKGNLLHTITK